MPKPILHSLLATLLLACALPYASAQTAECQTSDRQTENDTLSAIKILAARGPYTHHEDISRSSSESSILDREALGSETVDGQALDGQVFGGQAPLVLAQSRPVPPMPRRMGYPSRPRGHSGMWQQRGNGRHVLIGALIGFGIGAAIGAKGNQDQSTRARVAAPVLFGGAGALIGAAIGASHP